MLAALLSIMKKMSFSIFLIYVLAIFNTQASHAITNGNPGAQGVAVKVYSSGNECTGVIWKNNIVITAAHCVMDRAGVLEKTIRIGAYINSTWIYSDVVGVKIPKEYNRATVNLYAQNIHSDIAFLILKEVLDFPPISLELRIATLNDWNMYKQSRTELELLGYGFISDYGTASPITSPISAIFTLNVNLDLDGRRDWGSLVSSSSATCRGDSGGPVIYYRAAEKALVLVGIATASSGLDALNCGDFLFGNASASFTKLSSYSGLAASTINTEARYRPSALVLNSAYEILEGYRNSTSDLGELENQIPLATKKRLFGSNKNISTFRKLVDDYESKVNTYDEALNQSMDFVYINSGVLEANSREISASIESSLKKFEAKIDPLISKILKTLPLFVCSNEVQVKDYPVSKKCPKGYEKTELPKPFGDL